MKINLGCGHNKLSGYTNIDNRASVNPDMLCDVTEGLPLADNTAEEVLALDFLEHIPIQSTLFVINEIWRVLKHDGLFLSRTPDAEYGQGAWIDPTHVNPWVEGRWLYFSHPEFRKIYDIEAEFKIKKIERKLTDARNRVYHLFVEAYAVKNV